MSIEKTIVGLRQWFDDRQGDSVELQHAADFQQVYNAEILLKSVFPHALKDLLGLANGQYAHARNGEVAPAFIPELSLGEAGEMYSAPGYLCSVQDMLLETLIFRAQMEIMKADGWDAVSGLETVGPVVLHDQMLVISRGDGPDVYLVDTKPPEDGVFGQVVWLNEQPWQLVWIADGIESFVERILTGHQTGRYQLVNEADDVSFFTERPQ